jgi:hypothetical protein
MIPVSDPLIFPKVVPNDWKVWNKVWEQNKKIVPKLSPTKNAGQAYWTGFDIYVKPGIDPTDITPYSCKNVNCPELFPSLFNNIDKLPIEVHIVRVLQSLIRVHPHHDYDKTGHNSIRSLLIDTNPKQTWWYEDSNTNKHYLKLPEDTNTWWYHDTKVKHATDFYAGHTKQLIMYHGLIKESLESVLDDSVQRYSDYVIYV